MDDTIVIEKLGETHKQLTNFEELDEICEALKVMKLKTDSRNSLAARLGKVIEKMKSEQDEEETKKAPLAVQTRSGRNFNAV